MRKDSAELRVGTGVQAARQSAYLHCTDGWRPPARRNWGLQLPQHGDTGRPTAAHGKHCIPSILRDYGRVLKPSTRKMRSSTRTAAAVVQAALLDDRGRIANAAQRCGHAAPRVAIRSGPADDRGAALKVLQHVRIEVWNSRSRLGATSSASSPPSRKYTWVRAVPRSAARVSSSRPCRNCVAAVTLQRNLRASRSRSAEAAEVVGFVNVQVEVLPEAEGELAQHLGDQECTGAGARPSRRSRTWPG